MIAISHELRPIVEMQQWTEQTLSHQPAIVAADDFLSGAMDVPDVVDVVRFAIEAHAS